MVLTCREVQSLLPLFFDSELDARQMRAVAIHSARCAACEGGLRQLERVQDLVCTTVHDRLDEIDLSGFWPTVERRMRDRGHSRMERLRWWWAEHRPSLPLGGPALAAAGAGFALAFALLWRPEPSPDTVAAVPPAADHGVSIQSIESTTDVALLNEEDTLVLWIDEEPADVPVSFQEVVP